MASTASIWEHIVAAGMRLFRGGLIAGSEGNISVRLDDGTVMITPAGLCKGNLGADDAVLVDEAGRCQPGRNRPSSELPMHLFIYRRRPDVRACVHSHAPHATSFAVAGEGLADDLLSEMTMMTGPVPLAAFATPGTEAVAESLEPFIESHDAFLLSNHGLLTIGRSLDEAVSRHETVEHCARIIHLAKQLGRVKPIGQSELEQLRQIRRGKE